MTGSALAVFHRDLIVSLAARHRLPAVYFQRHFVNDGGLMSYGPNVVDQYRQAAGYVDRILKGEKPADLPVQAPNTYELAINLKTAKALGLHVPASAARARRRGDRMTAKRREVHHAARWRGGGVAARRARAAGRAGAAHRRAHAGDRGRHRTVQARIAAFLQALRQLGWTNGRNLRIDQRAGLGQCRRPSQIRGGTGRARAGRHRGHGTATVTPLLQATRTVPIVFASVADPVGAGFVDSLARPGGNATGFMQFEYSLGGKWLELLKQIAPGVTRAAVLRDASITAGIGQFAAIQSVAPSFGVEVSPVNLRDAERDRRAVAAFARAGNGGLILTSSALSIVHRERIIALAARHKLPAVYYRRYFVTSGGLISYGFDLVDMHRRAADYVDRILKGEKPADLPVQAPTRYELAINLKTAKALGLEVPASVLVRADEVIE